MIADLDESDRIELGAYDLCIVGSGPAGLTLARELADSGLRICVLESGAKKPTRRGDRLRRVVSEGLTIKSYSRERVLGGASTTWAGLSSPLDPIDVSERPYLRGSAWPIPYAELLALYGEAAERFRFPPLAFFGADGFGALRARADIAPRWEGLDEKVFLALSEPQDFGRDQRAVLEGPDVDLWLDATVLRLEAGEGRRIAAALARTSAGREIRVRARAFVLATGGIENARLLLCSRDLCPAGLGNEHDQVGRFFMNHPKNYHGTLHLARPVEDFAYYFGCLYQGYAGYAGLRLPEEVQRERRLLNSYVRLEPLFPWSDSRGVESLVLLVKRTRFVLDRWRKRHADEVVELRDYSETGDDSDLQNERKRAADWVQIVLQILLDLPRVLQYLWWRLVARRKPRIKTARLRNFVEMEPDPENRVTLASEVDDYGQPLPLVRHRCTELDRRSLVAVHAALAREAARTGLGRLETDLASAEPWPITQDASHHMGTTRMGRDPRTSVVDPDLKLHGADNVWIAGSSVFPSSGCANPTFTITALSIRLARRLRAVLGAPA